MTSAPAGIQQPDSFEFSEESKARIARLRTRYPEDRQASLVIPMLDLAQRDCGGWLPRAAMDHVAELLEMAPIRVYEIVSFYEMFYDRPRGKHELRLCTTTPCWLRGSADLVDTAEAEIGCKVGETSEDGMFSISEFECLGACVNAPIVWVDDDYFEDVDPDALKRIIAAFRAGQTPEPGSQTGRQTSAPVGDRTTLKNEVGS